MSAPSSTSIPPPPPSSRSGRTVDNPRNSFDRAARGAVPALVVLTVLFEHLEKIQRINSALGYQIGTFCALGLGLLAVYHRNREETERERDAARTSRTEAWIAALEREGARNREIFTVGYIDLKNAQAATDKKVDALAQTAAEIHKHLTTGPHRRLSLGGVGG